ncbi:MAG: ATP-dependent DNA ligase [Hyphomicrobiales bacterium]|nr:MAG: ATP-dependent DNA ligase [Hyphomicrobiales bacterium]
MTRKTSGGLGTLGIDVATAPMEAKSAAELPTGTGWQYEPKWDGFRCLAFRAGDEVEIRAKSGKSLSRFFPDVLEVLRKVAAKTFVLDGEIIIPVGEGLSFEALQMRLHPAASRIQRLARETPAVLMAFDCLLERRGKPLVALPFEERRATLERVVESPPDRLALTPFTQELRTAKAWLTAGAGGIDGVVAKRLDLPYRPGERAMLKIKNIRTADCVVGGFRYETGGKRVGSLLLGLYDAAGDLHHVGFTSALADSDKSALTKRLEKLVAPPGFTKDVPGAPSRWSTARSTAWEPLKPALVVEVTYDHVTGNRFRHGTGLLRWRPDKKPQQCTLDQIAAPVARTV